MRFPEFEGEWDVSWLGDIADVSKLAGYEFTKYIIYEDIGQIIALRGLNIRNNALDLSDVKYIDNSDLSKLSRSKLFRDDLMFTYIGTVGEVALIKENDKFYLAPNVARIRADKKKASSCFLLQYFNQPNFKNVEIAKYISSSSQPALTMRNVRQFAIALPLLHEQAKIATFLSLLDDRIATQSQIIKELETLMKGLGNKIFSQKLKFKGFDGKWKEKTLGDVLTEPIQTAVDNPDKIELLTVKLYCKGVENTGKHPTPTLKGRPYYRRFKNEILIGKQNFHNGGIGIVKENNDGKICPNAISSYCVLQNNLHFIYYYISRSSYYSKVGDLIGGTGQKEISKTMLDGLEILLPSKEEQAKIANFLSFVDNKLEIERLILKHYTDQKKYLLTHMFI